MAAQAHTIEQMRAIARRRIPRVAFDYLDGGGGREIALARNVEAFQRLRLLPRALAGCERRSQARTLFGRTYSAPFGVAPIGMAGLMWPGAELGLARAAARANIPFVLSTAATVALEKVAEAAPEHAWFQLYVGRDHHIVVDLIARVERAGMPVMCVTVDVPAPGKRLRDLANGFVLPLRPSLRLAFDIATHPAWALATLRAGPPRFVNLEPYAAPGAGAQTLAQIQADQSSARLDWRLFREIRESWPRKLLIKGLLSPLDARRAVEEGADGVIVSNHGGRQLDSAPAPIEVLAAVREAVGKDFVVLLDGGVRTGEDLAKALALGADFVLLGRAFMYGVAALGPERGPAATIEIMTDELDRTLAQLGCFSVDELGPEHIWRDKAG